MQVLHKFIHLPGREGAAESRHHGAAGDHDFANAFVVGGHAVFQIGAFEQSLQAWPFPGMRAVGLVAAVALAVENLTSERLRGIESEFSIAFAALRLASAERRQCQPDRQQSRNPGQGNAATSTAAQGRQRAVELLRQVIIIENDMAVAVKRVYEGARPADGRRVLVERLWPRGRSKEAAHRDRWLKEVAPSTELRQWFHQRPSMWQKFREHYLTELRAPEAQEPLQALYDMAAGRRKLTLVYASRDREHNCAIILKELLDGMRKPPHSTGPEKAAAAPMRARARR